MKNRILLSRRKFTVKLTIQGQTFLWGRNSSSAWLVLLLYNYTYSASTQGASDGRGNRKHRRENRRVDPEDDKIRVQGCTSIFMQTTVITIAHRLNTIIYYDKILVLERGEIKEYDAPLKLVKDENTFLGRLIRKTGKKYMESIIALAEKGVEQ